MLKSGKRYLGLFVFLIGIFCMNIMNQQLYATNEVTSTSQSGGDIENPTNDNNMLPSWDLSQLFENDESALSKIDDIEKEVDGFIEKYNDVKKNKDDISFVLSAIKAYENILDMTYKVGAYGSLKAAIDVNDEDIKALNTKVRNKLSMLSAKLVDFNLAMAEISEGLLEKAKNNKDLAFYTPYLKELAIDNKYKLSADNERLLAKISSNLSKPWVEMREEKIADIPFELDGESKTEGELLTIMSNHPDSAVRKSAFLEFATKMKTQEKDFATIYKNIIAIKKKLDDERGYERPDHSFLLDNHLTFKMIDTFVDVVAKNKLSHDYYRLKANVLGKQKLHITDRLVPIIVDNNQEKISWEEAKNTVLSAFHGFSKLFGDIASDFFDGKRVDATVSKNKRGGAFCQYVSASTNPFVFVSHQGDKRSVETLMHELGHGIHGVLSKKVGQLMQHASLAFCEVASMFSEKVLLRHLLDNETDNKKKIVLLSKAIEGSLASLDRQIAFHNFETKSHARYIEKGNYTKDDQQEIWLETQKESLGDIFDYDDENYKVISPYVGHFCFAPFYVHSYAVSEIIVLSLYDMYVNAKTDAEKAAFAEKFKTILEAGSGLNPDLLRDVFGIDMQDQSFWQMGMNQVKAMQKELDDLLRIEGMIK